MLWLAEPAVLDTWVPAPSHPSLAPWAAEPPKQVDGASPEPRREAPTRRRSGVLVMCLPDALGSARVRAPRHTGQLTPWLGCRTSLRSTRQAPGSHSQAGSPRLSGGGSSCLPGPCPRGRSHSRRGDAAAGSAGLVSDRLFLAHRKGSARCQDRAVLLAWPCRRRQLSSRKGLQPAARLAAPRSSSWLRWRRCARSPRGRGTCG